MYPIFTNASNQEFSMQFRSCQMVFPKSLWTTKFAMDAHSNWSQNQSWSPDLETVSGKAGGPQFTIVVLEHGKTSNCECAPHCFGSLWSWNDPKSGNTGFMHPSYVYIHQTPIPKIPKDQMPMIPQRSQRSSTTW
jgi:hypothetical protein